MKKRLLATTLCITMILGLTACGKTTTDPQIQSKNLMEDLTTPTPGAENPEGKGKQPYRAAVSVCLSWALQYE